MRIACLLIPDLPLRSELRASPELIGHPLVITSGPGARAEILAVSPEAAAYRIRPGQTLPQARAVCPGIEVRIASPILERTAREALLDVALSLAPRAELAKRASGLFLSEGAVFVDASGIAALHSPRKAHKKEAPKKSEIYAAEHTFASVFHARAERAGLIGFVTLASSRGVARLAARHLALTAMLSSPAYQETTRQGSREQEHETTHVLPLNRELDFLSPLPIDLLDPDDRTAQALTRFGIHRIQDLLRLPPRDLAARLGPRLLSLVARARGEEDEPPLPEPRTTTLAEGQDLEVAIATLEPLTFVLRGLVSRLTERLDLRGMGCVELRLGMTLENGALQSRRIGVASPCQDDRVLLRLLRLAIEKDPPLAPVEGVTLLCEGIALRREQLDLFLPRGPSPSALDETLAELGSICGEDRIGAPLLVDDHRPDAVAQKPFRRPKPNAPSSRKRRNGERPTLPHPPRTPPQAPPYRRGPRLTMRVLRPPMRAEVRLVRGRPAHLRSDLSRGEVVTASGPFRTTGHWWSHSAHFAVDHYDIQMKDGTLLRLRFDWKEKRWQIDGLYD